MLPRQVTRTIMDAARTALQGVRINFLLGSLLALGWAVAGHPVIVGAFGAQFAGAYLPLLSLLPGLVCLGLVRVCGGAVIRAGQPHRFVLINGVSLACNAGLNAWWIPLWGLVGAALASTVSYALSAFLFLYWTSRLAGTSGVAIIPGRADLAALRRGADAVLTRLRR
jgi:O-antigen/teichoic acid export membrane protein